MENARLEMFLENQENGVRRIRAMIDGGEIFLCENDKYFFVLLKSEIKNEYLLFIYVVDKDNPSEYSDYFPLFNEVIWDKYEYLWEKYGKCMLRRANRMAKKYIAREES